MAILVVLHAAAAVLLIVAGAAKIARPSSAAGLFESLGLPVRPVSGGLTPSATTAAALFGVVELGLGTVALAAGGVPLAVSVGVFYVLLAAGAARAVRAGAADCGCFGTSDTPPTWLHVIANLALAAASFAVAGQRTPTELMADQPAGGVGFVLAVGLTAGLFLALFTAVPKTLHSRRR